MSAVICGSPASAASPPYCAKLVGFEVVWLWIVSIAPAIG